MKKKNKTEMHVNFHAPEDLKETNLYCKEDGPVGWPLVNDFQKC